MADRVPPIESLVEAFWADRQPSGRLATPAPGAWALGGTAAEADALVRLVRAQLPRGREFTRSMPVVLERFEPE